MKHVRPVAMAMSIVMLLTMLSSCSSVKKSGNVVKEDDPWFESTRFELEPDMPKHLNLPPSEVMCASDDRFIHAYCYTTDQWMTSKTKLDIYDFEGKLISRHDIPSKDGFFIYQFCSISASPDGKTINAIAYLNSETVEGYHAFVTIDAESGNITDTKAVFEGEAKKLKSPGYGVMYLTLIGDYTVALLDGEYHGGMYQDWKLALFKDKEFVTECDMSSLRLGYIQYSFSLDEHSGSLYLTGYETGDVVACEFDIYNGDLKSKTSFRDLDSSKINIAEYTSTDNGDLCKIDSLGNVIKLDVNTMTPVTMIDTNWYSPYFSPSESEDVNIMSTILSSTEERTVILDDQSIYYGSIDSITYSYVRVLKKADKNPHAGKQIIELALPQNSGISDYLARSIYEFNRTDNEYLIRVWDAYKTGYVIGKTFGNVTEDDQQIYKMIQDLQSDEAPDLAIGIQKNYAMRDDIFKDLTGFLSPEILDKQYVNIFEAGRINGKLYFLPVTLEIEGLVTNTELLKDGAVGLTFEEYDELVEGPMNGFSPYDYPDSTVYNKRDFLLSCIDTKSAIEGDAVDFGTDQFRCAVEHAAAIEYDDLADTPREYLDNWNRYRGECYYVKIDDYLDYVYACFRPKGEYRIIGTPSVDASGPRFKALETVSVSASTDVEEGCKKFLNYLFAGEAFAADNCEFRQIVTNKEIMEKNIQSLTKINNDLYERYMASVQSGAFIPAAGLDKASGNKAATDVMHDCFTDSLSTISTYYYEDYTIVQFTLEELAPYYAGDRSLDDAIKYLNDRATKYIREM